NLLVDPAALPASRYQDEGSHGFCPWIVSPFHGNGATISLFVLAASVRRRTIPSGCKMLQENTGRISTAILTHFRQEASVSKARAAPKMRSQSWSPRSV